MCGDALTFVIAELMSVSPLDHNPLEARNMSTGTPSRQLRTCHQAGIQSTFTDEETVVMVIFYQCNEEPEGRKLWGQIVN